MPSVVEHADGKLGSDGYYHFLLKCFGTDAQAVKIAFRDKVNVYGKKNFTIQFNSNNGAGKMQEQKLSMYETAPLKKN